MNKEEVEKLENHMRDQMDFASQNAHSEKKQIDAKLQGYKEGCRFVFDLIKLYNIESIKNED